MGKLNKKAVAGGAEVKVEKKEKVADKSKTINKKAKKAAEKPVKNLKEKAQNVSEAIVAPQKPQAANLKKDKKQKKAANLPNGNQTAPVNPTPKAQPNAGSPKKNKKDQKKNNNTANASPNKKFEKKTKAGKDGKTLPGPNKKAKSIKAVAGNAAKVVKKAKPAKDDVKELVTKAKIAEGLTAFKAMLKKNQTEKNSILDPDFKYCIQICSFKVPQCPERVAKTLLPHTLVDDTDDVLLFVKDVEAGRQADYQPSIEFFKEQLSANGITNVKTIMPVNQLMKDYRQHEMKSKLCNTYDFFLADARIAKRIAKPLGKNFLERKKTPIAVRMNHTNLKEHFERALCKVSYRQVSRGNQTSINVAKHTMSDEQVVENIHQAILNLREEFPGSWQNVKSIYLRPAKRESSTVPLYVNLSSGADVPVPIVVGPKQKQIAKQQKKLNKVLPASMQINDKGELAMIQNEEKKKLKAKKREELAKNKKKKQAQGKPAAVVAKSAEAEAAPVVVKKEKVKKEKPAAVKAEPVEEAPEAAPAVEKAPKQKKEKKANKVPEEKAADDSALTAEVEELWAQIKSESGVEAGGKSKKQKKGKKAEPEVVAAPVAAGNKSKKAEKRKPAPTEDTAEAAPAAKHANKKQKKNKK